jgi:hypothetical protein
MMRIKAIVCEVLAREVYYCAARSPHVIDIELVEKGLHNVPTDLRAELQQRLDSVDPSRYDVIVLAYGLCGTATAGLRAGRIPIIMPRAHDCITLYLGSQERYQAYFVSHPGAYYYTADYIERGGSSSLVALGAGTEADMGSEYQNYVAKYGKDNADYLMEVMGAWKKHYNRATYIDIEGPQLPDYRETVKEEAARRGWTYEETMGQVGLLSDLLTGHWDAERFLRIEPGQAIVQAYDAGVIGVEGQQAACPPSAKAADERF